MIRRPVPGADQNSAKSETRTRNPLPANINMYDGLHMARMQMIIPLSPQEKVWRDLQPLLQSHGYMLEARYHPDWTPSPYINYGLYTMRGGPPCSSVSSKSFTMARNLLIILSLDR
jgi:hypothetical protein